MMTLVTNCYRKILIYQRKVASRGKSSSLSSKYNFCQVALSCSGNCQAFSGCSQRRKRWRLDYKQALSILPFWNSQSKKHFQNLLIVFAICISITSMENREIVDVLNVTFLEIHTKAVLLSSIVQSVQSLSLSFGNWWNIFSARVFTETSKVSSGILDNEMVILVVE